MWVTLLCLLISILVVGAVKWFCYCFSLGWIQNKSAETGLPIIYFSKGWWTLWLFSEEINDENLRSLTLSQRMTWDKQDIRDYDINQVMNIEYLMFVYEERGISPRITIDDQMGRFSCSLEDYYKFVTYNLGLLEDSEDYHED